jgi:hypothetical protein
MWIDHLSNGQAARGVFGNDIPELRGLCLAQVVVDMAGGIALALNLEQLPDTVPARWRDRGCDAVQFRMWFATYDLIIRGAAPHHEKVSIEVEERRLRMVSEDERFELNAKYIDGRVEFFPYRQADYEFHPEWYGPIPSLRS